MLFDAMPVSPETIDKRLQKLKDPDMLQELGSGYYLLERYEMAQLCWKRLLEVSPENVTGLVGLANLAWQRKSMDEFRMHLEKLAAAAPNAEEYLTLELQLSFLLEEAPRAIEWGEKLVKQNPTKISARQLLAEAYRRAGETEKVEEQQKAIAALEAAQQKLVEELQRSAP